MSKITVKQVKELADEADAAAQQAAEIVKPAHQKALEAARKFAAEKKKNRDSITHHTALAEIIEKAVDALEMDKETAKAVLAQYLAGPVAKRNITQTQATSGAYLWASLHRGTWDWAPDMRRKIIAATVKATRGEIDPGLARFERDWSAVVKAKDLKAMASFLNPQGVKDLEKKQEKAEREHEEAQEWLSAIEDATPAIWLITDKTEREVAV